MNVSAATDRLRRVLVVTILLVLLGAGSAAACWTAQARVEAGAEAASIGLEQSLLLEEGTSPLAGTYSAENLMLAGSVSIANTGTREAIYSLAVHPGSATSSALPAALRITAAPVSSAQECSPRAPLDSARTGILEGGAVLEGEVGAGASITVCVQTSLTAADHAALADGQLELMITSSLAYAKAAHWQIQADQAMSIIQAVEAAPPVEDTLEEMICRADGPWEPQLEFSREENEKDRNPIKYRMFISPASHPEKRIPLAYKPTKGWYTVVHLSNTASEMKELVGSEHGGYGNAWLHVEKKLPGRTDWTPAAQGKFHTTPTTPEDANAMGVYCGWQG